MSNISPYSSSHRRSRTDDNSSATSIISLNNQMLSSTKNVSTSSPSKNQLNNPSKITNKDTIKKLAFSSSPLPTKKTTIDADDDYDILPTQECNDEIILQSSSVSKPKMPAKKFDTNIESNIPSINLNTSPVLSSSQDQLLQDGLLTPALQIHRTSTRRTSASTILNQTSSTVSGIRTGSTNSKATNSTSLTHNTTLTDPLSDSISTRRSNSSLTVHNLSLPSANFTPIVLAVGATNVAPPPIAAAVTDGLYGGFA